MNQADIQWKRAIKKRAQHAEKRFEQGHKPTEDDIIAVALAHPQAYEIIVKAKEK